MPCGDFATSSSGALTCNCIGAYRNFGISDNSCRCKSRFVFRQVDGTIIGDHNGKEDCIPLVFGLCDINTEVISPEGTSCVSLADCKCSDGTKGTRSQSTGICTCSNSHVNADKICNQGCRQAACTTTYTSTGLLQVSDGITTEVIDLTTATNYFSYINCTSTTSANSNCKAKSLNMESGPIDAIYGVTKAIA
jgi:hypothetical protein